jgi:endonuclease/exonuclease/phosphatase family metal-dependent hydrolase
MPYRRWLPTATLAALALLLGACTSPITVATFNIRMFPEGSTDRPLVARRLVELDASVIAVQEIRDARALGEVLELAAQQSGRDYQLLLGPCGGEGWFITTGVVYDARAWEVLEHVGYPDLQPEGEGACGVRQAATGAVLADDRGRRLGVLSVHLRPFPEELDTRREQWARVVARMGELERRHGATVVALGDYNSTGFTGDPPEERAFVERTVAAAGYQLPTATLACTEYWRPANDPGDYRPSLLDHAVASGGQWRAQVHGMCERLACRPTAPDRMDPDYFSVSDHCPVVLEGRL